MDVPSDPQPRNRRRLRRGVSMIELLMVVALMGVLVGVGSLNYRNIIDQGNEERCRIDLRTIKKAMHKLENDHKVVLRPDGPHVDQFGNPSGMEPPERGVNDPDGFNFDKLMDFRLLTRLPLDPWGMPYEVNLLTGRLYSLGPDNLPDTGDEVDVLFKPKFEVARAHTTEDRREVIVEFTRKVDPFSLYVPPNSAADLPFLLDYNGVGSPAPLTGTTTAARIMTNPYGVRIRLDTPLPPSTPQPHEIHVATTAYGTVQAMDSAEIPADGVQVVPIEDF